MIIFGLVMLAVGILVAVLTCCILDSLSEGSIRIYTTLACIFISTGTTLIVKAVMPIILEKFL